MEEVGRQTFGLAKGRMNCILILNTFQCSKKFFYINLFIYLAVWGLCCCARAFSSCSERGLLFVAVRGLLIAVASLVAEHGLQVRGLQQLWLVGSRVQAQQLRCTGLDAPQPVGSSRTRAQPVSPAMAGGLLTTEPPGKSPYSIFNVSNIKWLFI